MSVADIYICRLPTLYICSVLAILWLIKREDGLPFESACCIFTLHGSGVQCSAEQIIRLFRADFKKEAFSCLNCKLHLFG